MSDIIERVLDQAANEYRGELRYWFESYKVSAKLALESPIEEAFLLALYALNDSAPIFEFVGETGRPLHTGYAFARVTPQVKVAGYRVDFLVEVGDVKIAVECDGQAYHNSNDQIQRDKVRDRALTVAGLRVMRFTGSEIFRSPCSCAYSLFEAVMALRPKEG